MTTQQPDSEGTPTESVVMVIDHDRCIGSGTCEMLEEEIFLLDDDTGVAGIVGDGRLPIERALTIVDRCPASAISFTPPAAECTPPAGGDA